MIPSELCALYTIAFLTEVDIGNVGSIVLFKKSPESSEVNPGSVKFSPEFILISENPVNVMTGVRKDGGEFRISILTLKVEKNVLYRYNLPLTSSPTFRVPELTVVVVFTLFVYSVPVEELYYSPCPEPLDVKSILD